MCLNYSPPVVATVDDLIPLSLLAAGQRAQVSAIAGLPDQVQRLEEMGLRGGSEVEMLQPGSPCIVRVGGQKLCFRSDDLLSVLVRPGGKL